MADKKIKIFFGSSLNELEIERGKLSIFIGELNNKFNGKGFYIEPFFCEEKSRRMIIGGTQKSYDQFISDEADAVVFIFYKKLGKYTHEEFDTAINALKNSQDLKRPAIFVNFKNDSETPDTEVRKFKDDIENDYLHYHGEFSSLDTIKYEILQYILDEVDFHCELSIRDRQLSLNNEIIPEISIDKIDAFFNNGEYSNCKLKLDKLYAQQKKARESQNYKELKILNAEIDQLEEEIEKIQKSILSCSDFLYKERRKHNSEIISKALNLFEKGNLKAIDDIIPDSKLISCNDELTYLQTQVKESAREIVQMARILIKTNIRKYGFANDKNGTITDNILEAALVAEDYDFIFDYVIGNKQGQYVEEFELIKRIEGYLNFKNVNRYYKAKIYFIKSQLVTNYYVLNHADAYDFQFGFDIGQSEYEKYLLLAEHELANDDLTDDELFLLSRIYLNISAIYNQSDLLKAEEYLIKQINLIKKIAEKYRYNKEKGYDLELLDAYDGLFRYYMGQNQYVKAETLMNEELQTAQKLDYSFYCLSFIYESLGRCYNAQNKISECEKCLKNITELYGVLVADKNDIEAATDNRYLAGLYEEKFQYEMAEHYYKKSLLIISGLIISGNCQCFGDMIDSYECLASLYLKMNKTTDAEEIYKDALPMFDSLSKIDFYGARLAYISICEDLCELYENIGEIEKADEYRRKIVEMEQ